MRHHPTLAWHTYPLGLLGADQTGVRRSPGRPLCDLSRWFDHVAGLGADAVMLGPIFDSLSHGYDTVDHRRIDRRLGDERDLDRVIERADASGLAVVLDGAFAYASRHFWRLAEPAERVDPWFLTDDSGSLVPWRVDSLVTPDHQAAGYQAYVVDVLRRWLDRGITGWRLDSAWSAPVGFWRRVLAETRRTHPEAWFMAQVFDEDVARATNMVGWSSVTTYGVMHGIRDWLAGGPDAGIEATLAHHRRGVGRSAPSTFVGNHDFARLADAVGPARSSAAFALLLVLPGVPAIYYGDEFGIVSRWSTGGSDALLRPALEPDVTADPDLPRIVAALGALRRASPWLTRADLVDLTVADRVLDLTVSAHGHALGLRLNAGTTPCPVPDRAVVLSSGPHPFERHIPPDHWVITRP